MKTVVTTFLFISFFSSTTFSQIKTGGVSYQVPNVGEFSKEYKLEQLLVKKFNRCKGSETKLKNIQEIHMVLKAKEMVDIFINLKGKINDCKELTCLNFPQIGVPLKKLLASENFEKSMYQFYGISDAEAKNIKKDMKEWIEGN